MNKEKAFIEVKELLVRNGIEFTVSKSDDADTITAKVGKIVQWFSFTRNTISVTSAVVIGKKVIEASSICKWYKDILFLCFIKGDLWIREKGFGYTILALKKDN